MPKTLHKNSFSTDWKRITICGGGNGAHALMALILKNSNSRLNLYLPLEKELRAFKKAIEEKTILKLVFRDKGFSIPTERLIVTSNPEKGAEADMIILVAPAFAHKDILSSLAPYLQPGTVLAAMPARSGFEFQAISILDQNKKEGITIAGFQTLPWVCRIREYARAVEIYGQKMMVGVGSLPSQYSENISIGFSKLLKMKFVPYNNMLEITLSNQGQIIHPGIMYGALLDKLGRFYREDDIPLFYRSVDENTADLLDTMSREILKVKRTVEDNFDLNLEAVTSLSQWMIESYSEDIKDKSTLSRMFQSNFSYRYLRVPVKAVDGLYQIDEKSRYLTEDIPYGLLVSKAIADLAGVPTPKIDEVIERAGECVGVQYLVNGTLKGKDLAKTRIPQNYGFESLKTIVEMIKGRI